MIIHIVVIVIIMVMVIVIPIVIVLAIANDAAGQRARCDTRQKECENWSYQFSH